MNEQTTQLQFFVVLVLEWNGTEPGLQGVDRERGLPDEVRVSKHVLVLCNESDERHVRIEDFKFTSLVPDRVETILLCECGWGRREREQGGGGGG